MPTTTERTKPKSQAGSGGGHRPLQRQQVDAKKYGRLLARSLPAVVETEAENDRLLGIVERLMAKGERSLSVEEGRLLELLSRLIEDFESRTYPIPECKPHEAVAFLLQQRGLRPKHLWPVIGSKGRVSELLTGNRAISKQQARKLADLFRVPADLFI